MPRATGDRGSSEASIGRRHAGRLADVAEIGDQPVGDVDGGGGHAAQRLAQRQARARRAVAVDQDQRLVLGHREPAQDAQAERRIAERAGHPDVVADLRAGPQQRLPAGNQAQDGERECQRAMGRGGIAAQQVATEALLVGHQPGREPPQPGIRNALGPGQHRQIAQRIGTHRGEVGQVHAQELARDQVGRVVGQEVDVGDDRVLGDHQLLPGRDIDQGGIVGQARAHPDSPSPTA